MPNVFLTNLRSIFNKFDDLRAQLISKNADIIICTETWLTSDSPVEAFAIPGYSCHRADRVGDSGRGGVVIWVRSSLHAEMLLLPTFQNAEICCVRTSSPQLVVVGLYLPPGIGSQIFKDICEKFSDAIDNLLMNLPYHRLIVAGDLNKYDTEFLSSKFSLSNIVNGPTRYGATLDFIFVDKSLKEYYDENLVEIGPPIGNSDHNVVFAKTRKVVSCREVRMHTVFDLRESYVVDFERSFLSQDLEKFYSCTEVEEKCELFYEFMQKALTAIPRNDICMTNDDAPWMTPLVKLLIDRRWDAYRRRNWELYNSLKIKVRKEIFKAKKAFFTEKSKSVKGLWSCINFERGSTTNAFRSSDSISSSEQANQFNKFFCSVMNPSSSSDFLQLQDDLWFPQFEVHDIWKMLTQIRSKSTGSDNIPTLLYKRSALALAEPIHHLISECIRNRKFPSSWKIADVVPIPKSNNASISDARPISLLPIPAKLAEKVILNDLRSSFSDCLGDLQFGIRKGSSTSHAIIAAHESLTRHFDNPEIGATVFISFDYSKAFDKVMHCDLLKKVNEMGLPKGFVLFLDSYLRNRLQRVRFRGCKSFLKEVSSGVPQGSLLGPYLFGMYIRGLQPKYTRTCMIKYVDDLCLSFGVRKSMAVEDVNILKSEIQNVSEWSANNNLSLNLGKTSGLVNYRGCFRDTCDIQSHFSCIKFQSNVKFLGVVMNESLNWKSHITFVEKKCAQRIYILRRMKSVTTDAEFMTVYCALIRSLIEYACPVFIGLSSEDSRRLQAIQDRCLKIRGNLSAADLSARRRTIAARLFNSLQKQDTFIVNFVPSYLPSGRLRVPFCRTTLRRNSFFPRMCIIESCAFCD